MDKNNLKNQDDIFHMSTNKPYIDTSKIFTIEREATIDRFLRVKNQNINCLFKNLTKETFDKIYNEYNKHLNLDFTPLKLGDKSYCLNETEKEILAEKIITHWIYFYTVNDLEIQIIRADFTHPQTTMIVYYFLDERYGKSREVLEFGAKISRQKIDDYISTVKATKTYNTWR